MTLNKCWTNWDLLDYSNLFKNWEYIFTGQRLTSGCLELDLPGYGKEEVTFTKKWQPGDKTLLTIYAENQTRGKQTFEYEASSLVDPNTIEATLTNGVLKVTWNTRVVNPPPEPQKVEIR